MHKYSGIKNFYQELAGRARSGTLSPTIENVRHTCVALAQEPGCRVQIDEGRAASFADDLDIEVVRRSSHYMNVPVRFPNVESEVCFHVTLHLFNFGHGFRHPLHEACGRGAWQTMKRGVEALHSASKEGCIDANTLRSLSGNLIDELFQLPPRGPSVSADRIAPLREMILKVAHVTGAKLVQLGYLRFDEFIADQSTTKSSGEPSAFTLVRALANAFPPFDDRRTLPGGKEVLFLKKAQIAVAELYQRLGDAWPHQFGFRDIEGFTVVCDNVLPCVLRRLGILKVDPELARKIDARVPLLAGPEEAQLRAAAIAAAEIMIQRGNGAFWAKELGDYLWSLGKDSRFRQVERHATIDTCFY